MSWVDQVKSIMDNFGVPWQVWVGAANAESGFNLHPGVGDGGVSYGLFQINTEAHTQFAGLSRDELEDPAFQANFMAPQFANAWDEAKNQGLSGPSAYNYAAWAAEKPYGYPYSWGLEDYSTRTGIGDDLSMPVTEDTGTTETISNTVPGVETSSDGITWRNFIPKLPSFQNPFTEFMRRWNQTPEERQQETDQYQQDISDAIDNNVLPNQTEINTVNRASTLFTNTASSLTATNISLTIIGGVLLIIGLYLLATKEA